MHFFPDRLVLVLCNIFGLVSNNYSEVKSFIMENRHIIMKPVYLCKALSSLATTTSVVVLSKRISRYVHNNRFPNMWQIKISQKVLNRKYFPSEG